MSKESLDEMYYKVPDFGFTPSFDFTAPKDLWGYFIDYIHPFPRYERFANGVRKHSKVTAK